MPSGLWRHRVVSDSTLETPAQIAAGVDTAVAARLRRSLDSWYEDGRLTGWKGGSSGESSWLPRNR